MMHDIQNDLHDWFCALHAWPWLNCPPWAAALHATERKHTLLSLTNDLHWICMLACLLYHLCPFFYACACGPCAEHDLHAFHFLCMTLMHLKAWLIFELHAILLHGCMGSHMTIMWLHTWPWPTFPSVSWCILSIRLCRQSEAGLLPTYSPIYDGLTPICWDNVTNPCKLG